MAPIIGNLFAALLFAAISISLLQPLPHAIWFVSFILLILAVLALGLAFGRCRRAIGGIWRLIFPPRRAKIV
jgi:hypothetical protein